MGAKAGTTRFDHVGQTFGRWTVLGREAPPQKGDFWTCRCSCGTVRTVRGRNLRTGNSRSCGCLKVESVSAAAKTHGLTKTKEHRAWAAMKQRCTNPKFNYYHAYGGRGISVCPRWLDSFEAFLEDLGPAPSPTHSVDRIDPDGDYGPANCRWATPKEQGRNTRKNVFLTLGDRTLPMSEWAEITGMTVNTIFWRVKHGWADEDVLTLPPDLHRSRGPKINRFRFHPK